MKSQKVETRSETPSSDYLQLGYLPPRELETVLLRGEPPDPDALAGFEFRGMNAARFTRLLGIKKFIKGFYKNDAGQLYGYNIPVVQDGLEDPWRYKNEQDPKRFGFYRVDAVDPAATDNAYLSSLLLDYGRGGNHDLDPTSRLRDYLVRVNRGSDELLLGKALVAVGPLRVPVGFFILERLRPSSFRR
jgi:hypothetical protein